FPRLPLVLRAEEHVPGVVDAPRILLRDEERGRPLEAVLHFLGIDARGVHLVDGDVAGLLAAVVVAGEDAAVFAGEDDAGIDRIGEGKAGLAAADLVPVAGPDAAGL